MKIKGIEKLSLTDYPAHVAAIIFTQGCNFKCPFCHNSDLIPLEADGYLDEEEIIEYLISRKNILDGVVITGGEPLLQKDIKEFIIKIKNLGLKVKLDTNGINYKLLEELINEDLIDYIAMDIKANQNNYGEVAGSKNYSFKDIEPAVRLLRKANIDYEFRTTIVKEFHDYKHLEDICNYLNKEEKYFLQNFEDSGRVLQSGLHGFSNAELTEIINKLNKKFPNVKVRGL